MLKKEEAMLSEVERGQGLGGYIKQQAQTQALCSLQSFLGYSYRTGSWSFHKCSSNGSSLKAKSNE